MGKPTNGGIKLHARSSTRGLFKLCECSSTTSSYICMQLDIENTKKYVGSFFFCVEGRCVIALASPFCKNPLDASCGNDAEADHAGSLYCFWFLRYSFLQLAFVHKS